RVAIMAGAGSGATIAGAGRRRGGARRRRLLLAEHPARAGMGRSGANRLPDLAGGPGRPAVSRLSPALRPIALLPERRVDALVRRGPDGAAPGAPRREGRPGRARLPALTPGSASGDRARLDGVAGRG